MPTTPEGRRPLKSRDLAFFKWLAAALARAGVSPNAISFSSMVFGAIAGAALAATSSAFTVGEVRCCFVVAAAAIQLRLIANLLDGMVAVEGGRGGPTGDLWNEAPDRVADAAIFIGAGFAAGSSPLLGFAAALMAVFVAYIRALGASIGAGQIFVGPMAKPQRMFVMTMLSIVVAFVPRGKSHMALTAFSYNLQVSVTEKHPETGRWTLSTDLVSIALAVIIVGCIVTAIRRLSRIATFLRAKGA